MKKKYLGMCCVYCLLFCAMLLVPFALSNRKPGAVSEIDNRKLVDAPKLGSGFTNAFETYLQDRIGFRDEMVNAYTVLKLLFTVQQLDG